MVSSKIFLQLITNILVLILVEKSIQHNFVHLDFVKGNTNLKIYTILFSGILQGHIVEGTYFSQGLFDGVNLTTLGAGRTIRVSVNSFDRMLTIIIANSLTVTLFPDLETGWREALNTFMTKYSNFSV